MKGDDWDIHGDEERERRRRFNRFGVALAVFLVAVGLAVVGFFVLLSIGISGWANNK